ncbi:MAG: IS701 family transposase [Planctomycetota bacterium]|jgi:SRSO17 transposase
MLPQHNIEEGAFVAPRFELVKKDVKGFVEKLREFHEDFKDCFKRSEPRKNFFRYMVGQFSDIERKSIEPIALKVEGGSIRDMQKCLSDAKWDEEKMLSKHWEKVNTDIGDKDGVLIFDESGFPKKGSESAGVGRQYCGSLGKVENCQVGVFSAYASRHGYTLLDKRLFLLEKWFTDEYSKRRTKCSIPEDLEFKTKPQLAVDMFRQQEKTSSLRFKYVLSDTLYGNSPEFIKVVDASGKIYFVSIACDTLIWLQDPLITEKEYKYKGEERTRKVIKKGKTLIRVDRFAKNLHKHFWYRRKVSEGAKGPITYDFTRRKVTLSKDGLPDKKVWLVIRRTLYSYYISNASDSIRLKTFVWLSGMRWPIEQCFGEAKAELGMDHYELRKYTGWNHHMLTCILAHYFLWHLRISLGEKNTIYHSVPA